MNTKIPATCAAALGLTACTKDQSVEFDQPPPLAIVVLEGPAGRAVPVPGQTPAAVSPWRDLRTPDVTRDLYDERKSNASAPPPEPPKKTDPTVSIRPPETAPSQPRGSSRLK